jgi:hypothetical protein
MKVNSLGIPQIYCLYLNKGALIWKKMADSGNELCNIPTSAAYLQTSAAYV